MNNKYNLNNTPEYGSLRIEFYGLDSENELDDIESGDSTLNNLMNIFGMKQNETSGLFDVLNKKPEFTFMFKGLVSDCRIYPKQIKKLALNNPDLLYVRIRKID